MVYESKYINVHKDFIRPLWSAGHSAALIADRLNAEFGFSITRSALIGIVRRMKLPPRETDGPWRIEGQRRREANLTRQLGPKPQRVTTALPKPVLEALPPIGILGELAEENACKWPCGVDGGEFRACGHPAERRRPYCKFHRAMAKGVQPKPVSGAFRSNRIR